MAPCLERISSLLRWHHHAQRPRTTLFSIRVQEKRRGTSSLARAQCPPRDQLPFSALSDDRTSVSLNGSSLSRTTYITPLETVSLAVALCFDISCSGYNVANAFTRSREPCS